LHHGKQLIKCKIMKILLNKLLFLIIKNEKK
jgi:hypothetical protein